jgi:hypothetical protein
MTCAQLKFSLDLSHKNVNVFCLELVGE